MAIYLLFLLLALSCGAFGFFCIQTVKFELAFAVITCYCHVLLLTVWIYPMFTSRAWWNLKTEELLAISELIFVYNFRDHNFFYAFKAGTHIFMVHQVWCWFQSFNISPDISLLIEQTIEIISETWDMSAHKKMFFKNLREYFCKWKSQTDCECSRAREINLSKKKKNFYKRVTKST